MSIYACSDLHGFMELYQKIKEYLNPEDKVYYLGDAGDRGPNSWDLIKAIANDEQFIYIKGNHEDMLVNAAKDYLHPTGWGSRDYMLLVRNGGERTFDGWEADPEKKMWLKKIDYLPAKATYKNKDDKIIILTHAGFTPLWNQSTKEIFLPSDYELIWNREHIYEGWDDEHFPNHIIVHGHTPIQYMHDAFMIPMNTLNFDAYWYCDNHKICIDMGTYRSQKTCLLNLDTFESHVFSI